VRLLTLLCCAFLVAGCGDEEGSSSYIAATIDGLPWRETALQGEVAYGVEQPDGWIFTIASRPYHNGHQLFSLNLPLSPVVGTYVLDGGATNAAFSSCPDDILADCIYWRPVAGHPGTLKITAVDAATGWIAGTFSFAGYPLGDSTGAARSFTNGEFKIQAPAAFPVD
jgi:hypothetical protein